MKVIVTGGAGFIGSHLVDKLIEKGEEVICVDNFLTGFEENIAHLKDNPKFKLLKHDVCESLPSDLEADLVFHLASPASPNANTSKSYQALPFETMSVNTNGTWNLAKFCIEKGVKLLFASTSEVYGDPLEHPQKESYNGNVSTTGPRAVYDEAKRFGETIISAFIRHKGLDGRIIRIFNTYGPRLSLDDGRVVSEFTKAALKGEVIPIFGSGEQSRSFCYISDLVEGIILAMEREKTKGDVFNLGNQNEIKVLDLAQKIKELANSSSEIKQVENLPEDDPLKRRPDISHAKEVLDWEPKVDLDEGLGKFIEYAKSKLS